MPNQRPRSSLRPRLLAFAAAGALALAAQESRATYMVEAGSSNTNKVMDGWCSLPEAIEAVNMGLTAADDTNWDCINFNGGNDIMLEGVLSARYKTFGAVITSSMSIYSYGPDSTAIIEHDSGNTLRIDGTEPNGMGGTQPISVYMSALRIRHTGTQAGRVIENRSKLYMLEVTISGGRAQGGGAAGDGGGIYNLGTLELYNANVTGNLANRGGGIFSNHDIGTQLFETAVYSNNASQGAGVWNSGRLHVQRSTISGNIATGNGGGVYTTPGVNSYCELYYTTVGFNQAAAGGGVFVNNPNFNPSGNIVLNTVTNASIIGSNQRPNGTLDDYSGHPNREEGMIETDGIRSLYRSNNGLLSSAPMDIVGQNPLLQPLAQISGSFTWSHALGATSPARGVALENVLGNDGFDQNYDGRPQTNADLGSVEMP